MGSISGTFCDLKTEMSLPALDVFITVVEFSWVNNLAISTMMQYASWLPAKFKPASRKNSCHVSFASLGIQGRIPGPGPGPEPYPMDCNFPRRLPVPPSSSQIHPCGRSNTTWHRRTRILRPSTEWLVWFFWVSGTACWEGRRCEVREKRPLRRPKLPATGPNFNFFFGIWTLRCFRSTPTWPTSQLSMWPDTVMYWFGSVSPR